MAPKVVAGNCQSFFHSCLSICLAIDPSPTYPCFPIVQAYEMFTQNLSVICYCVIFGIAFFFLFLAVVQLPRSILNFGSTLLSKYAFQSPFRQFSDCWCKNYEKITTAELPYMYTLNFLPVTLICWRHMSFVLLPFFCLMWTLHFPFSMHTIYLLQHTKFQLSRSS